MGPDEKQLAPERIEAGGNEPHTRPEQLVAPGYTGKSPYRRLSADPSVLPDPPNHSLVAHPQSF